MEALSKWIKEEKMGKPIAELVVNKVQEIREEVLKTNEAIDRLSVQTEITNKKLEALKEDKEFLKYVVEKREEDEEIIRKIKKKMKDRPRLNVLKSKLNEAWMCVFTNMRSRTEVIGKHPDGDSITIGKTGFGFRANVKTSPVNCYWDIKKILDCADDVAKALDEKKMKHYAKALRDFKSIVPDFDPIEGDAEIKLPKKILAVKDCYEHDRYSFSERSDFIDEVSVDEYSIDVKGTYVDVGDELDEEFKDAQHAIIYLTVRPYFEHIYQEICKIIEPNEKLAQKLDDELKNKFGSQMLLNQM